MTGNESKVLDAIQGPPLEMFFPFAPIMGLTGLDRSEVRAACRSLRTRGFVEYSNALSTLDGDFVGSGYAISPAGLLEIDRGEK